VSSVTEDDARGDLVALIQAVTAVTIDDDTEPVDARDKQVVIETSGDTPLDWQFRIKVYARGAHTGDVQTRLRTYRAGIEDALRTTSQFLIGECNYAPVEGAKDAWVCDFEVSTGREDF
jgi:hypothetical protein